jgi:LysM repeat protein
VQKGDTLSAIAGRNGMSLSQLLANNPQYRSNPNMIQPGQAVNLTGGKPVVPSLTTSNGQNINPKTGGVSGGTSPVMPDITKVAPDTTVAPTPEVAPPAPKTEAELAADAYQKIQAQTPEETQNAKDLAGIQEAERKAIFNTAGQAIPLEFVTGQQRRIQESASDASRPFEAQAALLQAKRVAALDASKFTLDRADKNATNAENTRQFNVTQTAADKREADAVAKDAKTFEENKRQFGLNYALDARKTAVEERKARDASISTGSSNLGTFVSPVQKAPQQTFEQFIAQKENAAGMSLSPSARESLRAQYDSSVQSGSADPVAAKNAWMNSPQVDNQVKMIIAGGLNVDQAISGLDAKTQNRLSNQITAAVNDGVIPPSLVTQQKDAQLKLTNARRANSIVGSTIKNDPTIKFYLSADPLISRVRGAMSGDGNAVSDQELLDAVTMLNTGGTRPTEAQVGIITHGQSYNDAIDVWKKKLGSGGVLSDANRQQLKDVAEATFTQLENSYKKRLDTYNRELKKAGIDYPILNLADVADIADAGSSGSSSATSTYQSASGNTYNMPF